MLKRFIPYLFLTTGVCVLLVTGHYFFVTKSRRVLVDHLFDVHIAVAEDYYALLQFGLDVEELRLLDPTSSDFHSRRIALVKSGVDVVDQGISQEPKQFSKVSLFSNLYYLGTAREINGDIVQQSKDHAEQSRGILEKQQEFYRELDEYYILVERVYAYDPQQDLGSLDSETQTGEIIRRLKSADEGLEHIKSNLSGLDSDLQVTEVINKLNITQETINSALNDIESGGNVSDGVGEVTTAFNKLKSVTYKIELDMLESYKDIWIEQEILIRELDELLDEIGWLQTTLIER